MSHSAPAELEILTRIPTTPKLTPLLFIHGAYAGAWCWAEHFLDFFAGRGYASYAVSLAGHGNSPGRQYLDSFCLRDYVDNVASVAMNLPQTPVLIGHSMGGMVVQKYLEKHPAAAAALLCSVPPQGLSAAYFSLAMSRPDLLFELNRLLSGQSVSPAALRAAMFAQPIDDADLHRYCQLIQPESYRAIWDMTFFDLPFLYRIRQLPLLVLGAGHDRLMPACLVHLTAQSYGVSAEIFPALGHGVMLEKDWCHIATRIALWLETLGL